METNPQRVVDVEDIAVLDPEDPLRRPPEADFSLLVNTSAEELVEFDRHSTDMSLGGEVVRGGGGAGGSGAGGGGAGSGGNVTEKREEIC